MPFPFMKAEESFPLVQAVDVFSVCVRRVHSIPAMGGLEKRMCGPGEEIWTKQASPEKQWSQVR